MKYIALIVLLILIFSPKKRNAAVLHHRDYICGASHDDLTEQGLCADCGEPIGW